MNTNKKELAIVTRAKKTLVGRCVCRLMGDETGAVMMEYVIVAVMIAAAVAVGAWFFGKDIMNMFGVAGQAATGRDDKAESLQVNANKASDAGHKDATKSWKLRNNMTESEEQNKTTEAE